MILGICTFVDLIIGSFEVSFLKYVVIGIVGLIVLCFAMYWDEDKIIVYAGIILIIISCIMTGLIIGLTGKSGWVGVLIFGIASYIVLIIFLINAICKEENISTIDIMGYLIFSFGLLISIFDWVGVF